MRILLFIIQKEFIQIFRNKSILPMMTVLPIVQLILLSYAANNEVKNVNVSIIDLDQSSFSRLLVSKVQSSDRFTIVSAPMAGKIGDEQLQRGEADVVLSIPPHFERDYLKEKTASLQLLVNAINGQQATVGASYLGSIIQSLNQDIVMEAVPRPPGQKMLAAPSIDITYANWFNPELNYKYFMTPGILGELVTILVMILTAMNIVREREIGTIEQVNVTPIRKWQFILGKMVPFLFIGIVLLAVGLTAGKLIFDIPIEGSLWVVFSFCVLNITAVLGLGLLISNMVDTQQQAMFVAFFFILIFILMSGLFTPIESMPKWAQAMTIPNPIAHFVTVMRLVLLKGSGWADVSYNFFVMIGLGVLFNSLAVWTYRKRA